MSINQDSGENSVLRKLKTGKISLRQLLASVTESLILSCCLEVMFSSDK